MKKLAPWCWALPVVLCGASAWCAPSPVEVVERFDSLLWGRTMQGRFEMTITTASWSRSLTMNLWAERPGRSFVRIGAPAKDAGILSLRIGSEMWNYLPGIERTVKVPPSMMLQPWLGSDFTNDDMVRESSIAADYTHRFVAEREVDGAAVYEIESLPKPDAPVVWGKLNSVVRQADFVPLSVRFYDERGRLVRTLTYSEVRKLGGRAIPTRWEMRPESPPGKKTTIVVQEAQYDAPIPADVFSLQNLTRRR